MASTAVERFVSSPGRRPVVLLPLVLIVDVLAVLALGLLPLDSVAGLSCDPLLRGGAPRLNPSLTAPIRANSDTLCRDATSGRRGVLVAVGLIVLLIGTGSVLAPADRLERALSRRREEEDDEEGYEPSGPAPTTVPAQLGGTAGSRHEKPAAFSSAFGSGGAVGGEDAVDGEEVGGNGLPVGSEEPALDGAAMAEPATARPVRPTRAARTSARPRATRASKVTKTAKPAVTGVIKSAKTATTAKTAARAAKDANTAGRPPTKRVTKGTKGTKGTKVTKVTKVTKATKATKATGAARLTRSAEAAGRARAPRLTTTARAATASGATTKISTRKTVAKRAGTGTRRTDAAAQGATIVTPEPMAETAHAGATTGEPGTAPAPAAEAVTVAPAERAGVTAPPGRPRGRVVAGTRSRLRRATPLAVTAASGGAAEERAEG